MTIDFSAWGWPQWVYLGIVALGLVVAAITDGTPLRGNVQFSVQLLAAAITVVLLSFGGFFS